MSGRHCIGFKGQKEFWQNKWSKVTVATLGQTGTVEHFWLRTKGKRGLVHTLKAVHFIRHTRPVSHNPVSIGRYGLLDLIRSCTHFEHSRPPKRTSKTRNKCYALQDVSLTVAKSIPQEWWRYWLTEFYLSASAEQFTLKLQLHVIIHIVEQSSSTRFICSTFSGLLADFSFR